MAKNKKPDNGWNEYEKLVMSKLDSHDKMFSDVLKQIQLQNDHLLNFKLDVSKAIEMHGATCKIAIEFPKVARDIEGIKVALSNIRRDEKVIADNTKDIGLLNVAVAQLQIKSGLWGAVGGMVSLATMLLVMAVKEGAADFIKLFTKG